MQIFGSDPVCMAEAAQIAIEHTGADIVDLNMGCPMGKIVNNGDGAALMKDPEKAGRIAEAVVRAVSVPVTAKFRRGWDMGLSLIHILFSLPLWAYRTCRAMHWMLG